MMPRHIQFTTEGIEIRTDVGPKSVIAYCAGGLAYHEAVENSDYYTVTHIASGLGLISYCMEDEAKKAIRAALGFEGADWGRDEVYIKANKALYREAVRAMKQVVRPEVYGR